VNAMSETDKDDKTFDQFKKIVKLYVEDNSPEQVNLSGSIKTAFYQKYKFQKENDKWELSDSPRDLLEPMRYFIFCDLYSDVFPRFLFSDFCLDAIQKYHDNEEVISKKPLYSVLYKLQHSIHGKSYENQEDLKEFAKVLSEVNLLKKAYLSTKWKTSANLASRLSDNISIEMKASVRMTQVMFEIFFSHKGWKEILK
jgi:hypothetical protein